MNGTVSGDVKRSMLLDGLKLAEWPDDVALEAVDLAMHACEEAVSTMIRITETGSLDVVRLQAMIIAGELITGKMEMARQQLDDDGELASMDELQAMEGSRHV